MRYQHTFQIGEEESVALHRYANRKGQLLLSIGLAVAGFFLMLAVMWGVGVSYALTSGACSGIFFFALVFFTLQQSSAKQVQELFKKGERKAHEQEFIMDQGELNIRVGRKTHRYDYAKLHSVDESRDYFFVYVKGNLAYTMAKAQMADPKKDCETIRAIFKETCVKSVLHLKG